MLDTRQCKDPQACNRGDLPGSGAIDPAGCPAWDDPKRSMLGAQKESWLGQVKADYRDPAGASVGVEFCGTKGCKHSGISVD